MDGPILPNFSNGKEKPPQKDKPFQDLFAEFVEQVGVEVAGEFVSALLDDWGKQSPAEIDPSDWAEQFGKAVESL